MGKPGRTAKPVEFVPISTRDFKRNWESYILNLRFEIVALGNEIQEFIL